MRERFARHAKESHVRALQTSSLLWCASFAVAGCAGVDGDNTSAVTDDVTAHAAPDATSGGPGRGAHGVFDYHFLNAGRTIAGDPSSLAIAALTHSHGDWQTTPAVVERDGQFSLPGVCGSPYLLSVNQVSFLTGFPGPIYIATDSCAPDLSVDRLGRVDATPPAPGTSLALDVRGLDGWDANDDLQLISPGAGLGFSSIPGLLASQPAEGATSVQASVDYGALAAPVGAGLIDARRGDRSLLTQLAGGFVDEGDVFFRIALTRAAALPDLVVTDGAATPVSAELVAVPQTTRTGSIQRDAFAALADSVHPGAFPYEQAMHVNVVPIGVNRLSLNGYPDVTEVASLPGTGDLPVTLTFGDPYPREWPRIGNLFGYYEVDLSVPTASGALIYTQFAIVSSWNLLDTFMHHLAPTVSPVRAPRIAGRDLLADQTGVSTTPTVSWQPPHTGHADSYAIAIRQLTVADGAVSATEVGELQTTDTQIALPPGLLIEGNQYVITITAVVSAGSDLRQHPFESAFVPLAYADAVSGVISP
jgi:hypothetical protein